MMFQNLFLMSMSIIFLILICYHAVFRGIVVLAAIRGLNSHFLQLNKIEKLGQSLLSKIIDMQS